jgi:glycosyltransferase involved in cell wall biosynthesis
LHPALQDLSKSGWQDRLELVIFGASEPENPPDFGFKAHYLGTLSDDLSLALVYSAADVFVLPSTQENLANTVMEAIACGTPCVTFNIGGMPDMIEHQKNGYLAQPYKIEELAQGLAWVLESEERHQKLSHRAREKAEQEFTWEIQSRRYLSLFSEILDGCDHKNLI